MKPTIFVMPPTRHQCLDLHRKLEAEGLGKVFTYPNSADSFNAISHAFKTANFACTPRPTNHGKTSAQHATWMFGNCAYTSTNKNKSKREQLCCAVLSNGTRLIALRSDYSLAFLKDQIAELWSISAPCMAPENLFENFLPLSIARLVVKQNFSFMESKLEVADVVRPYPRSAIALVEPGGDMVTTIRQDDEVLQGYGVGVPVNVKIGKIAHHARTATRGFRVADDELALLPEKFGCGVYWKLRKLGGSAYLSYEAPEPGTSIRVTRRSQR